MRLGHSTMWSGGGPIGSSEVSRVPKLPIAAPLSIGGVTWKLPQPLDLSSSVALNQAPCRCSDESRLLLLFVFYWSCLFFASRYIYICVYVCVYMNIYLSLYIYSCMFSVFSRDAKRLNNNNNDSPRRTLLSRWRPGIRYSN